MITWRPDPHGVLPGLDVGGDVQWGEAYEVRFLPTPLPRKGKLCPVITIWYYPVIVNPGTGEPEYPYSDDDVRRSRYKVCRQVEYMLCTDPADVGSTEEWSDTTYRDGEDLFDSAKVAEQQARDGAEHLLTHYQDVRYLAWNGQPIYDHAELRRLA